MALTATRTRMVVMKDFPEAADYGIQPGKVTIESEYWDHPNLEMSLLLRQSRKTFAADTGQLLAQDDEEWFYDYPYMPPTFHSKMMYASAFLPGASFGWWQVREELTSYWFQATFYSGRPSYRKLIRGYAIFDLTPVDWDYTKATEELTKRHRKLPSMPNRIIPDSGRAWHPARTQGAIVEKVTTPQKAVWQMLAIEQEIVEEDWQKWITNRYRHDYLSGISEAETEETIKDPVRLEYPLTIDPPALKGQSAYNKGVELEITGGGSKVIQYWPTPNEYLISPDTYQIFRRIISEPPIAPSGDPMDIFEVDPAAEEPVGIVENTGVVDYGGVGATILPPQTPYGETEDNSVPTKEWWEMIAEVKNSTKLEGIQDVEGHVIYFDTGVNEGVLYEYYATALIERSSSVESNKVQVTYHGPYNTTSGLDVARRNEPDGPTVDVGEPDEPPGDGGETEVIPDMPVDEGGDDDVPIDVGKRVLIKDREKLRYTITPTVVLLGLQRGMQIVLPQITWDTWGNQLHITTQVDTSRRLYLEGFEYGARRESEGSLVVVAGDLILEETT